MTQRLITREGLCKAIKISGSSLRQYISRGNIKEARKGYIDLDDEHNKHYILTYSAKKNLDADKLLYGTPTESRIGDIVLTYEDEGQTEVKKVENKYTRRRKPKAKRGRPKKQQEPEPEPEKKKRGRPKKYEDRVNDDTNGIDWEKDETVSYTDLQRIKTAREIDKIEADTRLKTLEFEKKKAKVLPLEFVIEWSALNIKGVFSETVNFTNTIIEQICNELDADIEVRLKFKKKFKQGFDEIVQLGIKNQRPEAIEAAKDYSLTIKW